MRSKDSVGLKDLLDVDFLQDFQDNFAYSVGVASLTEDEHGNPLTRPSCFSVLCMKFFRSTEAGRKRCRQSDVWGVKEAVRTGRPAVYECHAGLIDFAAPIMLDGRNIGAIYGGQVLTEAPDEEKFRRIACEAGIDPEEYVAAVKEIPVISEAKLKAIVNVLFSIANTLSEKAYQTLVLKERNRELVLAYDHLNNILQTMSDGVITFDEGGIVIRVNPSSEQILGIKDQDLIDNSVKNVLGDKAHFIDKLLSHQESFTEEEVMVDTKDGFFRCLASGKPIKDDQGVLKGGLILLRPIERVQKLVHRFSGAQATFRFRDIIGESAGIREAIRMASLAASSMSTVLLQGESGTGKELFAQAIHNRSPRRKGPFVAVNCGAIPRELIASELFGYEGGAFTGAKRGGRPGKFELASGGTLFLDEIGEMPLEQQVALLRVLQERRLTRLGGDKVIPVDVRVICATNKNLLGEVEKGNFRRDLYYRVNVITINIPPLRERPEDIPILFKHFLERISREWGKSFDGVDPEVVEHLKRYRWPGNVRELQNVVERMVSIAEGSRITAEYLPEEIYRPWHSESCEASSFVQVARIEEEREKRKRMQAERERRRILELLSKHGGNISRVARELGVSRNTIYRKMKIYNININK